MTQVRLGNKGTKVREGRHRGLGIIGMGAGLTSAKTLA